MGERLKNKHFLEKHDEIDVCRQVRICLKPIQPISIYFTIFIIIIGGTGGARRGNGETSPPLFREAKKLNRLKLRLSYRFL